MRSRRYLPLLVATLVLSACDSGDGDGGETPSALVGSWTYQATTSQTLGTVNRTQPVLDLSQPGAGGLQIAGEVSATLRYVGGIEGSGSSGSSRRVTVFAYDPQEENAPYPRVSAEFYHYTYSDGSFETAVRLYVQRTNGTAEYAASRYNVALFTFDGARVRVSDLTLQPWYNATSPVTLNGTLTPVARTLTAGEPGMLATTTSTGDGSFDGADAFRYVFEADGAYRAERVYGNLTRAVAGRWEVAGEDRLRLSVTEENVTETTEFTYALDGGALRLSHTWEECGTNDTFCLRDRERAYLIQEGTLTRVERAITLAFGESAEAVGRRGAAAAMRAGEPRPSAPPHFWPRLLVEPR